MEKSASVISAAMASTQLRRRLSGLIPLLLILSVAVVPPRRMALAKEDDHSLNKQILFRSLRRARSAIMHGLAIPSLQASIPCKQQLEAIQKLVGDMEARIEAHDWEGAKQAVLEAIRSNEESACWMDLTRDSDEIDFSFLASELEKHLLATQNELDIITAQTIDFDELERSPWILAYNITAESISADSSTLSETELNRNGCPESLVDGSKCQYSTCGRDYGLVSCAIGFAKGVVGGLHGIPYLVTSDADNALNPSPGTLRYAVNLARGNGAGVWITFARSMIIKLQDMLWVQSHTTIDGRGKNITITGRNVVLGGVQDVIIHNIQISNIKGSDTLHIFAGSKKVWVDHVTSFNGELGLASVLQGSTDVTISNCNLQNYNFNMLLGASDADFEDRSLRVTVYRNWFRDSMQRMPHCRWGICHVANNLYTNWGYYAIGGRANARVRSESNVFMPSKRVKEITPWFPSKPATFDMSARIESRNDVLLNGATFHQFLSASSDVSPPYPSGSSPPIMSTSSLPSLVEKCSGALFAGNLIQCQQA